jgi:hypothetical protein
MSLPNGMRISCGPSGPLAHKPLFHSALHALWPSGESRPSGPVGCMRGLGSIPLRHRMPQLSQFQVTPTPQRGCRLARVPATQEPPILPRGRSVHGPLCRPGTRAVERRTARDHRCSLSSTRPQPGSHLRSFAGRGSAGQPGTGGATPGSWSGPRSAHPTAEIQARRRGGRSRERDRHPRPRVPSAAAAARAGSIDRWSVPPRCSPM